MKKSFVFLFVCLPLILQGQTLDITSGSETYPGLTNYTVNMSGTCELHLTNGGNPIPGTTINLNSEDAWVYFENVYPSDVNSNLLSQINVNGLTAVLDQNVRVVQYLQYGCVVIPHGPDFMAMEVFQNSNYGGTSMQFKPYDYNGVAELGILNNNISSFRLKKGYMATIAQEEDGTGYSKNYVAAESDITISSLPSHLNDAVSYVRVIPWRWSTKKGFTSGDDATAALHASWYYNWAAGKESTLNIEYVPMKWGGGDAGSNFNDKVNSTHVLAYNEPSHTDQSNLTVEEAIKWYPSLLKSGLRVGSPGIADNGKSWLYSFIDRCDELNYRVDFVAVHWYKGGQTAQQMYNWLEDVYNRTGRPVWVTEWNNGANWTCCLPTYEEQAEDVEAFITMMDNTEWIERYSIYNWVQAERAVISTWPDVLTLAGEVYRDKVSPLAYNPNMQYNQPYVSLPDPVGLSAILEGSEIVLKWRQNAYSEDGFKIERSIDGGSYVQIATTGEQHTMEAEYRDQGATPGAYTYRVRAFSGSSNSGYTNTATVVVSGGTQNIHMGQVAVGMPSGATWIPVSFGNTPMTDTPVVIMGPPSYNGSDPLTIRIKNVSKNGFEFKLDEWNYLDGKHGNAETVTYLAMLPGTHDLNGVTAVAFNQDNVDEVWDAVNYGHTFSGTPAIIATQVSNTGGASTAIRLRNITSSGFEIRLQEEEKQDDQHSDETISIIAFSQGTGILGGHSIGVDVSGNSFTDAFSSINFGSTYTEPGFLANIQTFNDSDPCVLRYQSLTTTSVQVKVEEEKSNDSEVSHGAETVGWIVIKDIKTVISEDPPGVATNPTPSEGASNVSTSIDLSWTAGSNTTSHDVYFGTDATPDAGELQGNQAGTTFNPGTLINSTTYYWRIDEVNSYGTTTGNVWSFTTEDPVPCTSLPYGESFESGLGDFTQASGDDGDWTNHSGPTGSSNTGPSGAADGSYYMYIEASTSGVSYPDNVANLVSPCLDLSGASNPALSFQYHMYGASMGTLNVDISTNGGSSWTNEWTITGDQGNSWHTTDINLSAYAGQANITIRFNGITGSNYTSDICIDVVQVAEGTTPDPPVADFSANVTTLTEGGSVNFTDNSTNNPTSWSWTFDGGTPSGSTNQNPTVTYNTAGTYNVSLTATNAGGSDGETKSGYITVNPAGGDDYAPLPYATGFESGSVDQYWTLETENSYGRIEVSSGNSPNGSYHLISDVTTDGNYSTNAGLLHVNLSGYTDVDLSFVWKEFSDEDNTEDGIFVSDDGGSNFTKVYDLTGGSTSFAQVDLDIDQLASSNGLSLTNTFIIKFQHRDNYTLATDGMAWDDISVTGSTNNDPPAPASSPDPVDGATDVSLSAQLSWTAGAGATSHDVYFGTTNPPASIGNQAGTSYDLGTLSASTIYYWRIDEVNANGTTTGIVWSFTTGDGTSYAQIGSTDVFGSTSTSGNRRAMPYTMTEDGTIESISMYHTGGSGDMILAVYDGASEPANRLGITPTTVVSGSTDWQTINLTSPVSVTSGTQIWLAWVYESNPGIRYESGSPGRYDAGEGWSGGMPDPFGGGSQSNYLYSIYATYTTNKSKAIKNENIVSDISESILIYPNPAGDKLYIDGLENESIIKIYNIVGEEVIITNQPSNINIDHLESGMFIIKLDNGDTYKFFKK